MSFLIEIDRDRKQYSDLSIGQNHTGKEGVLGQSRCESVLKAEGKFLKYCCKRCIQMSFSQRRVTVVVILSPR